MSLDMYGHIDLTFQSRPAGGVTLYPREVGDYTAPGGTWEATTPGTPRPLAMVNIQPADPKKIEHLTGGVTAPQDFRVVHINDGTMIYPDDDGTFSDMLEFSDGLEVRKWRVRESDCRPWRNFCRVVVERYRGSN